MLNHAASDSILVTLDLGDSNTQLAFLQDVQHNAITGEILHVDFWQLIKTHRLPRGLPLELTGEPEGVKLVDCLSRCFTVLRSVVCPKIFLRIL